MMTTALALVGACSPDEPEPSPTTAETSAEETPTTDAPTVEPTATPTVEPTPTEVPTLTLEEQVGDEATTALHGYNDLVNEVARAGYHDWQMKLSHFWGTPELVDSQSAQYESRVTEGLYMTGVVALDSVEVVEVVPDPTGTGFERVRLRYCADYSGRNVHTPDGTALQSAEQRVPWETDLQRQGSPFYTILNLTPLEGQTC